VVCGGSVVGLAGLATIGALAASAGGLPLGCQAGCMVLTARKVPSPK
jgi:hypothetical protein